MLRDNFESMTRIAQGFGATPAHFSWVKWPVKGKKGSHVSHVVEKYNSWLTSHPTYTWSDLVQSCNEGRLGSCAYQSYLSCCNPFL